MAATDSASVTAALRSALAAAMAQRDRAAMAVYRSAIAAIENAEAVPLDEDHRAGAIGSSVVGAGRTEAERRSLTREDEVNIVTREVQDRRAAADSLAIANPDAARRLQSDAEMLQALLEDLTIEG